MKSGSLVAVVMAPHSGPDARRRCRLGACQSDGVQPAAPARGAPTRPPCAGSTRRSGVDVERPRAGPRRRPFGRWFADVAAAGVVEPNAMVLATVGVDGAPAARTVLLKGYDGRGLRFFTNLGSAKAADLAANPRAALVFPWHPMARQVRVTGSVVGLGRDEVEAYFATRPRESQLGAWASPQSQVVGVARRAGRGAGGGRGAVPRRGPGAAGLGRLPGGARGLGVLGRPDRAAARPAALPAYRRVGGAGCLDDRAPRALSRPGHAATRGPHRGGDVSSTSPRVG